MISIDDLEEITDSGEIRIEQYKMKIKFWISEIEEIQKMKTYHISRYYLAECNELSVNSECKKRNNWVDCFMCKELKHEEYYVCGFIANGRDYGMGAGLKFSPMIVTL